MITVDLPKLKEALRSAKPWALLMMFGPTYALGWLIVTLLRAQGKITADDAQNVAEIIKAGADSNVDEMTIIVERENTLGLDALLKELKTSRPFSFMLGMKGETVYQLHVKYKG